MNLKKLVKERANDKYPNNKYVLDRIERELDFLEKTESFKAVESILEIRKQIEENLFFRDSGFLVFYLLGLDFVNPMPAHYYNLDTKEIIFDNSKEYGIDLEEKEGYIRDGFNLNEEYLINLGERLYLETSIRNVYKEEVISYLDNKFLIEYDCAVRINDTRKFDVLKEEACESVFFDDIKIYFPETTPFVYSIKNVDGIIDVDDFKKYTFGPYYNKIILYKNYNRTLLELISEVDIVATYPSLKYDLKVNSYKKFMYIYGDAATLKIPKNNNFEIDLDNMIFPTTKEDVFDYLRCQGYSKKESAQITNKLMFCGNPQFECDNPTVKNYMLSLYNYRLKADLIKNNISLYLTEKLNSEKVRIEEERLFKNWKRKYDEFVPDGMVDPISYVSSNLKITFILKEVNAKDSYELIDFLRNGAVGSTWNNIARWSAGILFNKTYDEVKDLNKEDRKKYLTPITVINLKKTPGGPSSNDKEIANFAENDREYIMKQLEIYKPDVIICCGTGRYFLNQVIYGQSNRDVDEWIRETEDLWYMWNDGRLVVSVWHPQQRSKGRTKEFLFKNIPLVINKILKREIMFLDDINNKIVDEKVQILEDRMMKEDKL